MIKVYEGSVGSLLVKGENIIRIKAVLVVVQYCRAMVQLGKGA